MNKDPRIDEFIAQARPFAQPILKHLRKLIHKACPSVVETIKWKFPHYEYKGMMCGMAAFQKHCTFGFWKAAMMTDPHQIMDKNFENGMGQFGKMTSLADLPPDEVIIEYIHEAMKLNDNGVRPPKKKVVPKKELVIPEDFIARAKKNKRAWETFQQFSYSKQKDYIEWFSEAKQAATREKRLTTAIEWLSEGKSRHWKYEKC
jgi:uncharacterized protein YdeI (YjbR/CyaY-like superfamily)